MLKKELIKLCMLHILEAEDRYGYEMLSLLHDVFPYTQESAIYALLRDLSRAGLAQTYFGDTSGGPARKYYRITESGRKEYATLLDQWKALRDALAGLGL